MRKVKPQIGAWAVLHHVDYPYLIMGQISVVDSEFGAVHFENAAPYHHAPVTDVAFCVADKDAVELQREITQLRDRYTRTVSEMERRMGDMRKRSTLGSLDPRP